MTKKKSRLIGSTRSVLSEDREGDFNFQAHEDDTAPTRYLWTSKATLAAGTFSPFHPLRPGAFIATRASLSTAGSTATKFDILIDGISIFEASTLCEVPASVLKGKRRPITKRATYWEDSKIQVKIDTVGTDAVGPAVVEIEVMEAL